MLHTQPHLLVHLGCIKVGILRLISSGLRRLSQEVHEVGLLWRVADLQLLQEQSVGGLHEPLHILSSGGHSTGWVWGGVSHLGVGEPISHHPGALMGPEGSDVTPTGALRRLNVEHPLPDTREVPQVEYVVELGGSGQHLVLMCSTSQVTHHSSLRAHLGPLPEDPCPRHQGRDGGAHLLCEPSSRTEVAQTNHTKYLVNGRV